MSDSTPAAPKLGAMYLCLNVKNLAASMSFYEKLGFARIGGDPAENWAVMECEGNQLHLFQGHILVNLINFRGGNPFRIEKHLEAAGLTMSKAALTEDDGSDAAEILDPDGNVIYFNTHMSERIAGEYEA